MKDFQLRNDTKLLYRSNPVGDIAGYVRGKRVLFVYGGGSADRLVTLFSEMGVDMYFDGTVSEEDVADIDIETSLSTAEVTDIMKECLRK